MWGGSKDAFDNDDWAPLYHAVYYENSAITLALLTAGADASVRCGARKNAVIHIAASMGNVEVLRLVIEHVADVEAVDDVDQSTALHYAGAFNDTEAVDASSGLGRTSRHGIATATHLFMSLASYSTTKPCFAC